MRELIKLALNHVRTVLLLLVFFTLSGIYAYTVISKESFPDIVVPFVVVQVKMRGISAEDSERLLVRPLERKMQSIEGVQEMKSEAKDNIATVVLEFQAGFNIEQALADVRKEVALAKADFPEAADDPRVEEVNLSHFPILTIILSGNVPERTLFDISEQLKEEIEAVDTVLKAPVFGKRDAIVDIILNPRDIESYGLFFHDIIRFIKNNNISVATGSLDRGHGGYSVKVPGLIESVHDLRNVPLQSNGNVVVTLKDVADIKPTFKKSTGIMRSQGAPSIALNVSKRTGENIIETTDQVRNIVEKASQGWHRKINVTYAHDESGKIRSMLHELQNNVILAVALVILVIVLSLGARSALLVSSAIPGAFLMGILYLYAMGYTLNIVVLFALILSVGMLVDGAIIIIEYADRKLLEGATPWMAYREAAIRMMWPVVTSIVTILVVFCPLLYWPGIMGEFMKFLPITLIATLSASLLMALFFIPSLGSVFGGIGPKYRREVVSIVASESGKLSDISGATGWYVHTLDRLLNYPWRVIGFAISLLIGILILYSFFGRGIEFFPNVEPKSGAYIVRARGNLSLEQKDLLMREIEHELSSHQAFNNVYVQVGKIDKATDDTIGKITVEFVHWKNRLHADKELNFALSKVEHLPGITIEVVRDQSGPNRGKPISLVVLSNNLQAMNEAVDTIQSLMKGMPALMDIQDNRPVPEITWEVEVDREKAAVFDLDVHALGHALSLVTDGLEVDTFRPHNSREEVSIIVRYPEPYRSLEMLDRIKLTNSKGHDIPAQNFVKRVPKKNITTISRLNGARYYSVEANVIPGALAHDQVKILQNRLQVVGLPEGVDVVFKGEEDRKNTTGAFLKKSFLVAIFSILLILVTQFNSFFYALLVLSSVVLATFGVFVGLLVMQQPFSIVMTGLGIIALSGIIVSNNIIVIDTFNHLRDGITDLRRLREAVLRTGAQRVRPVILTKLTTVLGLLPILFRVNIDFVHLDISIGNPSSEWWVQLATAIIFGVLFASLLTLIVTPSALYIWERRRFTC